MDSHFNRWRSIQALITSRASAVHVFVNVGVCWRIPRGILCFDFLRDSINGHVGPTAVPWYRNNRNFTTTLPCYQTVLLPSKNGKENTRQTTQKE